MRKYEVRCISADEDSWTEKVDASVFETYNETLRFYIIERENGTSKKRVSAIFNNWTHVKEIL